MRLGHVDTASGGLSSPGVRHLDRVTMPESQQNGHRPGGANNYMQMLKTPEASRDLQQSPQKQQSQEDKLAELVADCVVSRLRVSLSHMEEQLDTLSSRMVQGRRGFLSSPNLRGASVGAFSTPPGQDEIEKRATFGEMMGMNKLLSADERELEQYMLQEDEVDHIWDEDDEDNEDLSEGSTELREKPFVDRATHRWKLCMSMKEPKRSGIVTDIVEGDTFSKVCMAVILSNAVFTIYSTNYFATPELPEKLPPWARHLDCYFLTFYGFEVFLKLYVHRLYFFWNQDWCWNVFDFFIVFAGIVQMSMEATENTRDFNINFLRVCRLLRISKILRIFKAFYFLRELRLMAECVLGSIMSLVWATSFLAIIMMMFALVAVQRTTSYRLEMKHHNGGHCPEEHRGMCSKMPELFGSVQKAMLVLFESTTGGTDWGDVFDVVSITGISNSIMFICFISFFTFAFFNIVTSIFVDKAMKLAKPDEEAIMLERREEEIDTARRLRELIKSMDADGSGHITFSELEFAARHAHVQKRFEMLGITLRDVKVFFVTLCSIVGTNRLSIDRFVDSCMKMKGPASGLDVQAISFQIREVAQQTKLMSQYIGNIEEQRALRLA